MRFSARFAAFAPLVFSLTACMHTVTKTYTVPVYEDAQVQVGEKTVKTEEPDEWKFQREDDGMRLAIVKLNELPEEFAIELEQAISRESSNQSNRLRRVTVISRDEVRRQVSRSLLNETDESSMRQVAEKVGANTVVNCARAGEEHDAHCTFHLHIASNEPGQRAARGTGSNWRDATTEIAKSMYGTKTVIVEKTEPVYTTEKRFVRNETRESEVQEVDWFSTLLLALLLAGAGG